jgi:hypothetical protein
MRSRRAALIALTIASLAVGAWAQFAPASFHTSFPFGRAWVSTDGPFNEHLIRDVGGLNLALGALTGLAALRMHADLVRLAAVVTLVFSVPHLTYHALHLEPYAALDAVGMMLSLGLGVVVPAWLAWSPAPRRRAAPSAVTASAVTGPARASGKGGR